MRWYLLILFAIILTSCTPTPNKYTVTHTKIVNAAESYSRQTISYSVKDNLVSDVKISVYSNTSDQSTIACNGAYTPKGDICWNLSCEDCWVTKYKQQNTSNGWYFIPILACTNMTTVETCSKYKLYTLGDIEKTVKGYIKTYEAKPLVYPWLKDFVGIAKKRSGCNDLICYKGGYLLKFRSTPGKDYLEWERKIIWN